MVSIKKKKEEKEEKEEIRDGQYGKVLLKGDTAIKTFFPSEGTWGVEASTIREMYFYSLVKNSPYFVKGEFQYKECEIVLVMKRYKGDCHDIIREPYCKREKRALDILKTMALALFTLKKCNLVHRDIKLRNIMYDDNGYYLGDFGLARPHSSNGMTDYDFYYLTDFRHTVYSFKTDILQLGISVCAFLMGYYPKKFNEIHHYLVKHTTKNNEYLLNLLRHMVQDDDSIIDIEDILKYLKLAPPLFKQTLPPSSLPEIPFTTPIKISGSAINNKILAKSTQMFNKVSTIFPENRKKMVHDCCIDIVSKLLGEDKISASIKRLPRYNHLLYIKCENTILVALDFDLSFL